MISRNPDVYLRPLYRSLNLRCSNSKLEPASHAFYAAKSAVSTRMKAIDTHAEKFKRLVNYPRRLAKLDKRMPIESQVLFDFFANGLSALESFCFASYYVGAAMDTAHFPVNISPKCIVPLEVSRRFSAFDVTDKFTFTLSACLRSSEYQLLTAMRNMLLHRLHPGRSIRPLAPNAPHEIDLDLWYGGHWSRAKGGTVPPPKLKFLLEADALSKQRNWIDKQLESLSGCLVALAAKHGLS